MLVMSFLNRVVEGVMKIRPSIQSVYRFLRRISWLVIAQAVALIVISSASAQTPPPGPVPSTFFGMHTMQPYDWPTVPFGALGKGSGVNWAYVEPARGEFNWSRLDQYVNDAQAKGVGMFYIGGGVPPWAAADQSSCQSESYGVSCTSTVANIADLDNFMTALVTRYKGRIQIYELFNEPQNSFTGTTAELVAYTQAEHDIIRSIDPAATILSPSAISYGYQYLDDYFAAGGTTDIDGVAMHAYPNPDNDEAEAVVGSLTTGVKAVMAKYGLSTKPLWDTETSWGYESSGAITNPDLQAAFVARNYLLHWSMGTARAYWYGWDNANIGTMWSIATGVSEAAIAYEQVYKWMVGATMPEPCSGNGYHEVYTCDLTLSTGNQARAVWNPDGNSTYTVPSQFTQYLDLAGHTHSVPSSQQVTIGVQPILLNAPGAVTSVSNFQVSATAVIPASVVAGGSTTSTIKVDSLNNFSGSVVLACDGLPAAANCSFNPATVSVPAGGTGTSTLIIATPSSTAAGSYTVSVVGTSAGLTSSATIILQVTEEAEFEIAASALSPATVAPGTEASSTITVTPLGGFDINSVTLSCTSITLNGSPAISLPPACSFSSISLNNAVGTATLTVRTSAATARSAPRPMRHAEVFYAMLLQICGMAFLGGGLSSKGQKLSHLLLIALILCGPIFLIVACGGGGNNQGGSSDTGTPAGMYSISVVGTPGPTQQKITLNLTVRQ